MTSAQYHYRMEYLRSREWKSVRRLRHKWVRYIFGDTVCECCMVPLGNKWRHGHHVVYPQNWYATRADDIRIVCVPCHEAIHRLIEKRRLDQKGDTPYLWERTLQLLQEHRRDRWQRWEKRKERRKRTPCA